MWYKKINRGGGYSIKWMVFLAIAVAMLVPSISYSYGTITGNVGNLSGQSLSGVTIEALCNNAVVKAITTDTNGRYSLANLLPEVYSIRATISGYTIRFFPSPVRVSEGTSVSDINISLSPIGQGMIVFDSIVDGNREIYAVNATSTGQIARSTYNLYDDYDPCTSINGQKISFVSDRDGNPEVYIMTKDGSSQSRITYNNASDISPSLSPDANRVAFSSNRDGNYEIYLMDTNGSNPTRLTNNSATDSYPAFSPDGRKIAFSSNRGSGYDLYLMNVDGSGVTRLTSTADTETTPVFSPDGQKIAFCLQTGTNTSIYSVNVNGTGTATLLTEGSQPAFSPDGKQISFCSARAGSLELYVINTDGTGGAIKLPSQPQAQNNNPSWSIGAVATGSVAGSIKTPEAQSIPDALIELMQNRTIIATTTTMSDGQWTINNLPMGLFRVRVTCAGYMTTYLPQPITITQNSQTTANILLYPLGPFSGKIAFVSSRDGNQEIYICNADGSKQTRLTYNQVSDIDPCLSPDGKKIAFTSRRSGNEDIFIMNSDGSDQRMLTNTQWNDCYPSFSPDGKKIAFTSYRYGNADIFLMDIDTLEVTRLTNNPWDEQTTAFSPDGDNIIYEAFVNNMHKVYIMSNDGRNQHRLTTSTGNEYYPSFSPDGETITFTSNSSMDYEIYTMNITGTDTRRLTNSPGRDFKSCFAPDGCALVFYSERQDGYEIYTMNEEGSNVGRLTLNIDPDFDPCWGVGFVPIGAITGTITNKLTNAAIAGARVEVIQGIIVIGSATTNVNGGYLISELPAGLFTVRVSCAGYIPAGFQGQVTVTQGFITPDINISLRNSSISQTKIAFTSYVTNDNAEIYIVNHDGSRPTRLTYSPGYDGDSVISQDGQRLVFCSNRDGNSEIYIMEDDGSTQLRLTNNSASDRKPQFSPDGGRLVFTSNRDGRDEIYTMDTKGNNLQRLTYTTGNSCDPSFSPDGTRIVFSSTRDRNYEIYIMTLDGLNLRRLTTNSAEDRDPVFSPDGTRIVFWSSRDGNREIYTMNIDGSGQRRLTYNTGVDDDPFFSPDGSKIAFCSTYNNKIEVYTMDPDGTHQERVTFLLDNIYTPIWGAGNVGTGSISGRIFDHLDNPVSGVLIEVLGENMNRIGTVTTGQDGNYTVDNLPIGYFTLRASLDGYETRFYPDKLHITTGIRILPIDIPLFPIGSSDGKIVFTANRDGNSEMYVMNADGTSQSRLTNSPADEQNPSFSPDGTRVLFASNRDGNSEIYLMNADGTEQKRLTDNSAKDSAPVFSPDGRLIAFHSDRSKTFEIYTMNADGSNQLRLGTGLTPCFSPDGSRIVFARYYSNNYDIFIMNRDGSDQKRLTTNTAYDYDPVFSPDGEQIAFTSHRDGNAEVYIMNIDGSNQRRLTNSSNYDGEAGFSPDGKLITFVSGRLGNNDELWVMDINGNNAVRLTNNSSHDYQPSWTVASVGVISSSISGTITSQGVALQNALVELMLIGVEATPLSLVKSTLTNAKGVYTITVPGTGTYSLRCSAEGYAFRYLDTTISLTPGTKKTAVNLSLIPIGAKGGKIAFVSDWKGNPDIYICNADGSNITRLTNSPDVEAAPALSYDGSRIVFHANAGGDTNELYIMNSDGSSLRRLTTNSLNDEDPHLLIDGKTIVYASGYDHNKEIYTLDVNTLLQKRLTYNFYNDSSPRFSPDGRMVVFCSERDGLPQVYIMNADGSNQANLTNSATADCYPSFSMDGSKVLFMSANELREITLLDGSIRTLSAGSGSSRYSPDNKSVVYSLGGNIHTIGSSSLSLTTNSANNHSPSWSVGEVRCGGVYGLITNAIDLSPIKGAMVSVCQGTTTIAGVITGTNGRYSLSNLVAEKYSLKVTCPGYAIKYFTEDVSILQDTNMEIKLSLQPMGSRGGKIAFVSDRDGNKEIYIMNGDGSNQTRLTENYVDDYDPGLSPDGARVAFCSIRDGNEEIYAMDAYGTNTIRLTTSPSNDRQPIFSPDGTKIAWTANRDGDDDIYIMDADGKNQKKLTNSMANEYSPCFSPDNKKIAFCSDYQGDSKIFVMDVNGQGFTQVVNIPGGSFNPCFSPDGLRLIFWAATNTDTIYTMNIGETGAQVLRSGSGTLSYSSDGEGIAFVLNDNICVMNATGSFPVIGYGHNYSPSWSTGEVKTGTICGTIIDGINKKPIAQASVKIIQGSNLVATGITDASGGYSIPGLVAGKYLIYAAMNNYATQYWQGFVVVTASNTTKGINLQLTPIDNGGKIAFVSDSNGNKEIYAMNVDSSNLTNLTGCPAQDFEPCLSADGKKMVFTTNRDGNDEVYIMDTEGTRTVKRLTNDAKQDYEPCISPDSKRVVFTTNWDGDDEIYMINIDGTGEKRLTNNSFKDSSPCFSPDGTRIAFCSNREGKFQIYLMNIDDGNTRNLTGTASNNYNPSFSPDGSKIAFWSNHENMERIFTMNIDGSQVTPISDGADNPCFSPDGTKLTASMDEHIWMMDIDGNNKKNLTDKTRLRNNYHSSWAPDSVKTGSFSGIITDSLNSTPVYGARVEAFQGTATISNAITDVNGVFLIQGLVAEPYSIRASAADYNTQCIQGTMSIMAGTDTPNVFLSLTSVVHGGLVAFSSNDGIYLMNAAGTVTTRLTPLINYTGTGTPPGYYAPDLSPDGRRIVFSSNVGGNMDIYMMDTSGQNMVKLTNTAAADDLPCFSPDGGFIAFTSGNDICLMNIKAGTTTTLLKATRTTTGINFSPDGTRIIFCSSKDGLPQVYSMDIRGTITCNLTGSSSTNLSPSFSPDARLLVFSSDRDGGIHRLYLMEPDGSNQVPIPINLDSELRDPCFSPDGTRVIFRANNPDLYTVRLDGSDLTQLTFGTASDTEPSWSAGAIGRGRITGTIINKMDGYAVLGAAVNLYSNKQPIATAVTDVFGGYLIPDVYIGEYLLTISYPGRYAVNRVPALVRVISDMTTIVDASLLPTGKKNGRIAFVSQAKDGTDTEVYIMNTDGSNQQQLTSNPFNEKQPCISSDGEKIAFVSDAEGNDDIYMMNSNATNKVRLTTTSTQDHSPRFSTDGKKVVFVSAEVGIKILDLTTLEQKTITGSTTNGSSPCFSPDSSRIAFVSEENIHLMNVDGTNPITLTGTGSKNHSPTFSPDGLRIAFVSDRDGNENVYIMDNDGANQGRLTSNTAQNLSPSFSPDGQYISFYSNQDGNNEIYTCDIEGRGPQRLTQNLIDDSQPSWGIGDVINLTGGVSGLVSRFLNSIPIYGAKVAVYQGATLLATTTTGINGTYSLSGIHVGICSVVASHPEYITMGYGQEVQVTADSITPDINLNLPFIQKQGRFAFVSNRDGNPEIYTMNGDVSNQQRLTFNDRDDTQPSMSMDGTKIAFVSSKDGNDEIYIMDEEGQGQRRLTISEGEDSHPSVSADGSKITFCSDRDGNFEIYSMNIDGTNQTRLTKNKDDDQDPCFSLDGRKIVYTSVIDGRLEICLMNSDGSNQTRLTNNLYPDYQPCLSPDGKKIAYTGVIDNNEEIFIMNVDGSGALRLTNHPDHDYDPQFSPDGTRIAFCSDRDGFNRIYVMNLDGEGLYSLINLEPNNHLSPIMNLDSMEPAWVSGGYGRASIAGVVISAVAVAEGFSLPSSSSDGGLKPSTTSMEPVFGARIEAVQGTMVAGAASSGPTGKYTIFGLTPGIYRLRVSAHGYATQWMKESIVIKQDQATSVIDFEIIPIGSKGGKITFVSDRSGSNEIFVMNGDGTNQTRLTWEGFNNYTPEFSYDSNGIVFVSDRTGNNEIYIMEADGTNQKRLTHSTRDNQSPIFSLDNKQVVFSSNNEFMVMNIDGTGQRRLESNLIGKSPAFSPDGTRFVFAKDNKIFISSNDGVNFANLTDELLLQESEPVFSPDGETIAFTAGTETAGNDQEGYLFSLSQRTIIRLAASFRSDAISSYSPDGKRIAFTTDRDSAGKGEIYSMTLDGSGQMRLTNNNANDYQPSWAPGDVGPGGISGVVSSAFGKVAVKKAPETGATAISADTATAVKDDSLAMPDDVVKPDTTADKTVLQPTAFSLQPSSYTPIPKALVEVLRDGVVITSTLTDANGQYSFTGLVGGNYLLRCSAPPEYGVKVLTKEATIAIEGKTIALNMELFPVGASGGRIVFVSGEYGNPEICSIYPDSSGLARLTDNPANDRDPALSPDGSRVVFVSDRDGNDELYLMNIDGTCQMRLTNTPMNESTPVFSSDGKKIAYCSQATIFLMNSDGSGVVQLTENSGSVFSLGFSSDGTTIAFASNGHVYSLNTSLITTPLRLTGDNTGFNTTPCFSPDGTKLAFASDRDGNSDIYQMNTDGTNQIMVTNDLNKNTSPAFSPDGNMLVFCSQMDNGKSSIAMIGMDGKNRRIVMDSLNNNYSPCWGIEYQGTPTIPGSLSVTTIPEGARVYLNGMDTNKFTPCVLSVLPGTHTITLTRDWYEVWKGTATINKEQFVSLSVVLCGSISLASSPSEATVYLDGTTTGKTTPCVLSNIPVGTHTIGLSKDGYQSATCTITITGTTTCLNVPLVPATTSTQAIVKMESTISGKNISTNISVTGTDKLVGAHLILHYDIGNINIGSITPGTALSGCSSLFFPQVSTQTGKIDISLSVLGTTIPAGNLLNITSLNISEGTIEPNMVIVLDTVDLRDGNGNQISCTISTTSGTTTPPATTTSGSTLGLSPSVISVAAGDIFPMDIVVKDVTDLTVAEIHLLFNPQLLQVVDSDLQTDGIQISGNGFINGEIIRNMVDNSKGLISFTTYLLLGTATGNGTVATIFFKSIRGGTTSVAFSQDAARNQETKLLDNHLAIPISMSTATVMASGSGGSLSGIVGILETNSLFFTDQIIVTLNGIVAIPTDKAGYFCFSGIAPGTYTITADISGASPATRSEIVVVEHGQVNIGTISLLAGDTNNDGAINGYDLLVLRSAFGSMKGSINWNPEADFRTDGYINGYDLLSLRHNFGMISRGLAPFINRSTVPVDIPPVLIGVASLSIEPRSINPVVNNIFTVKVRAADIKDLAVAELHLAFNPEVLEVVDVDSDTPDVQIASGDFPAKADVMQNQADNQTGKIDFTSYLFSNTASGSGVLATISFRAKAVGTTGITFEFNTVDNRETKVLSLSGAIPITANDASLGVSLKPLSDRFIGVKAYPNPLIIGTNDEITIEGLPTIGMVDIKIYNIAGELVREKSVAAPDGTWKWNARNNDNQQVASGIYIYLMTNDRDKAMGKIAVIK